LIRECAIIVKLSVALRKEERRGISLLTATLLLIVIAIIASVLVYTWVVGYAIKTRLTTPEVAQRLKIEAGRLFRETATSNNVNATLYVRNVGGSPVYINASYLLTTAGSVVDTASASMYMKEIYVIDTIGYSQPATLMALEAGMVYTVKIRFTNAWSSVTPDATYIVKIVTSLGSEFRIELRAQGASISAFKFYSTSYTMMSGSYVSGRLPESLVEVDDDAFIADSEPIEVDISYTPTWLKDLKASSVEGDVEKLSSNDDQYLVVYPAGPLTGTLFTHRETITVGGKEYFLFKAVGPDGPYLDFQASYASSDEGKYLLLHTADGRDASFLYPLKGSSMVSGGMWKIVYCAYQSGQGQVQLCVDISVVDADGNVVAWLASKAALTTYLGSQLNTYIVDWYYPPRLYFEPIHAYLKVDYYAYIKSAQSSGGSVYLRVDNPEYSTRLSLPSVSYIFSKLVLEVGGLSNTADWVKLVCGVRFKSPSGGGGGVDYTFQLYNYAEGGYSLLGGGGGPIDEGLYCWVVTSSPERFRSAVDGSWRMLINATLTAWYSFTAYFDHVFFNVTYKAYVVQPVFTFTGLKTAETTVKLAIDMASKYSLSSLPVEVALWNYRASRWDIVYTYTSNPMPGNLDAKHFEVTSGAADYVNSSGEARIYVKAISSTGPFRLQIDLLKLTQYLG
jgi:FlaG/FlaF family flagellin (archaellin)